MKLEKWALIAEIVGAFAVVISLVYVGASVRQNTDAIMSTNHQNILAMDIEKNSWFRDPEFAALYESGLEDIGSLSAAQMRQFVAFVADQVNIWEYAFISHKKGLIDDVVWEGYDTFYSSQLRLPSYQSIWKIHRAGWSGDFARHAEAVLAPSAN